MELVKKIRKFLKDNKIDYLLVNSTNEFLEEYSDLSENSRYLLTKFSGSTGDALISQKDIFLFVDGRYHKQADVEVDKNIITVVNLELGESINSALIKKIPQKKIFALVSKKNSQARLELFKKELKSKNVKIKLLDSDPFIDDKDPKQPTKFPSIEQINATITGFSANQKFKMISSKLGQDEAILITNSEEISYLCNLRDFSKPFSSKIKGKCLIAKDFWWKCLSDCNFEEYIKKLKKINKIFVDKASINAYDYSILGKKAKTLKTNYIKEMKSVKTKEEIEHYKECFRKTDMTLMATRDFIENNSDISESDIAKALEENFYVYGAKSLSFKPIVAKDKNSALAHYSQSSAKEILKDGSLVLIDCGAYYEGGYATDCTRVFVKGKPSALQKKIYTTVLKGFLAAFNKKLNDKTTGFALDEAARKILNTNKPEGFEFSHALGHGLGISVHESPPNLSPSKTAKSPLKLNMCFTIEPGLYNPKKFGVRLENSCYLTEENNKRTIKSFSNMCFEEKLIDKKLLTKTEKKQLQMFEVR